MTWTRCQRRAERAPRKQHCSYWNLPFCESRESAWGCSSSSLQAGWLMRRRLRAQGRPADGARTERLAHAPTTPRWQQAVGLFTHVHVRMSGMIARPAHPHPRPHLHLHLQRVGFSVPLRFKPETCPSQASLEPRMARRNKRRGLSRAPEARSISFPISFFFGGSGFQMKGFFGGGVPCSKAQHTTGAVCQLLMVQSCGRPGHLRLAPDNEYDEDG